MISYKKLQLFCMRHSDRLDVNVFLTRGSRKLLVSGGSFGGVVAHLTVGRHQSALGLLLMCGGRVLHGL